MASLQQYVHPNGSNSWGGISFPVDLAIAKINPGFPFTSLSRPRVIYKALRSPPLVLTPKFCDFSFSSLFFSRPHFLCFCVCVFCLFFFLCLCFLSLFCFVFCVFCLFFVLCFVFFVSFLFCVCVFCLFFVLCLCFLSLFCFVFTSRVLFLASRATPFALGDALFPSSLRCCLLLPVPLLPRR